MNMAEKSKINNRFVKRAKLLRENLIKRKKGK